MGLVEPVIQISKPTQSIVSAERLMMHSHDPVFLMHRVVSYGLLCCAFTVHDKPKDYNGNASLVQSNRTVHSLSYMHVHAADPHLF